MWRQRGGVAAACCGVFGTLGWWTVAADAVSPYNATDTAALFRAGYLSSLAQIMGELLSGALQKERLKAARAKGLTLAASLSPSSSLRPITSTQQNLEYANKPITCRLVLCQNGLPD